MILFLKLTKFKLPLPSGLSCSGFQDTQIYQAMTKQTNSPNKVPTQNNHKDQPHFRQPEKSLRKTTKKTG